MIEISSGAANALLKLMGTEDSPLGRAISKYLFWLEMLSLSGELTVALQATLKKNAIEVLEHTDELAKLEKQANEVLAKNLDQNSVLVKEAEEMLEMLRHLEEVGKHSDETLYARQRKRALEDFINKFGKELIEELRKHNDGFVKYERKIDKFGNPFYKKKGVGGHSYQAVLEGKLKIKGETIPPNLVDDEPFIALLSMFDETNPKSFVKKNNSTLRINGKQNRQASTMFPKNWDNLRIEEEIAFAFDNKKFISTQIRENGLVVETFRGKASTNMWIEFIYNDGILTSTPPLVKTN